jgi:hypothetical protein
LGTGVRQQQNPPPARRPLTRHDRQQLGGIVTQPATPASKPGPLADIPVAIRDLLCASGRVHHRRQPVLEQAEARALLDSIGVTTPIGLRERVLIVLMVYSFGRI